MMQNSDKFRIKLSRPTADTLKEYIGRPVKITFTDGETAEGTLGYTEEFSEKYGYRKPNYFTVGDYDFKVSHIKSAIVSPTKTQDRASFYDTPER